MKKPQEPFKTAALNHLPRKVPQEIKLQLPHPIEKEKTVILIGVTLTVHISGSFAAVRGCIVHIVSSTVTEGTRHVMREYNLILVSKDPSPRLLCRASIHYTRATATHSTSKYLGFEM